jgi:streptomycin 6-kinase
VTALVPPAFAAALAGYPPDPLDPSGPHAVSGADWVRALPRLLDGLLSDWDLRVDGPTRTGSCSVVVPVVAPGGPAALKVSWPHTEARCEHLALRRWAGRGAVRLLRADPARFALLLERLDADTDLTGVPVDRACAVIGGLLRDLRVPALAQVPALTAYAQRQARGLADAPPVIPRRFVEQAGQLAVDLVADAPNPVLLHTDLHYANVLAGSRAPWLAIDPKPMSGDPAYEVAPVLWNRAGELSAATSMRAAVNRRLDIVCDHAGIDVDRARAWTIVREVDNATDVADDPARVTLAVAIVKAMNP